MEEMKRGAAQRTAAFVITVLFLLAMVSALIVMFVLTTRGAQSVKAAVVATAPATAATSQVATAAHSFDDRNVHRLLARLAWLSIALLGMTALMLFWVVTRFLLARIALRRGRHTTDYVDAWALAGQRVKPLQDLEDEGEGNGEGEDAAGTL